MSERWPGGIVRSTPVTPAGPLQNGAASGVWSLADAAYWTKQGLWPLAGNTLAVEDVFSTWLYTGTSAAQTITNGINISGNGGLVWIKERSNGVGLGHYLFDTARGLSFALETETAASQANRTTTVNAFNSNGFSMGSGGNTNNNGTNYASWTFRKQPNFFDIVTWTGNGANRNIAHNLGSVPGMILVKRTDTTSDWQVYHRSNANTQYMVLNSTAAVATGTTRWNSTTPTATEFTVGTDATVNASGGTYVAYLFAHDTASDGLIQCGSYTGNGAAEGPTVTLGWEPQWVMVKNASSSSVWAMVDNMRGMTANGDCQRLDANQSAAESSAPGFPLAPTATGFQVKGATALNGSGQTSIYIAIRRGPMKTPTLGTSVFAPVLSSSYPSTLTAGFPVDVALSGTRTPAGVEKGINDRLRGFSNTSTGTSPWLVTQTTAAETPNATVPSYYLANNTTITVGTYFNGTTIANYLFRRAPGFFDEVCYTGTGVARTLNHNLGVVPELMIVKSRSAAFDWVTYTAPLGPSYRMFLNATNAATNTIPATVWGDGTSAVAPTATLFSVGGASVVNFSGTTYVAYLFASCPGVSKVGSYTGNGSSQTINCAFTTGARYVLIKRTDSTGDWYVWDSARGIVAGNDPYLALNTTAAEVTTNDSVDTDNTGFIVNQVAASNVNVNGATYIFLAIA